MVFEPIPAHGSTISAAVAAQICLQMPAQHHLLRTLLHAQAFPPSRVKSGRIEQISPHFPRKMTFPLSTAGEKVASALSGQSQTSTLNPTTERGIL